MSLSYCPVTAQVVSTDPENHAVYVQFQQQGNEQPTLPARVLVIGPFDGRNIIQKPLPRRGTIGLVVAVNGDPRSLVWLGSIAANGQDAITSGPGNDFIEYSSHFSGFYSYMDESGNSAMQWPDGTLLTVGVSGAPALYWHSTGSGQRQRVPLTTAERVPIPPNPFPVEINHATGTKIQIDSSGNVNVSGVANINIHTPSGDVNLGDLLNSVYQLVDSRFVSLFNNHQHSGVQSGGSNTGTPTTTMAIGSQTTVKTFAN